MLGSFQSEISIYFFFLIQYLTYIYLNPLRCHFKLQKGHANLNISYIWCTSQQLHLPNIYYRFGLCSTVNWSDWIYFRCLISMLSIIIERGCCVALNELLYTTAHPICSCKSCWNQANWQQRSCCQDVKVLLSHIFTMPRLFLNLAKQDSYHISPLIQLQTILLKHSQLQKACLYKF